MALVMVLCAFASCNKATDEPTTTEATQAQPEEVVIHINKNLVDETSFITAISEFEGIKVTSDDTFHILTMSQATYITFLKAKAQDVYDAFDQFVAAGSFIEDINYNENFRTVKVIVDRDGVINENFKLKNSLGTFMCNWAPINGNPETTPEALWCFIEAFGEGHKNNKTN